MTNLLRSTEEFMKAAGQLEEIGLPVYYSHPTRQLRRRLSREENKEYMDAEVENNRAEIADGLLDQIVVHWGTMLAYFGPELSVLLANSVGDSNLSKILSDGSVLKREDGKVLKPEGYSPPRIREILEEWDDAHPPIDPTDLDKVRELDRHREGLG